jgi:hypothetical protein
LLPAPRFANCPIMNPIRRELLNGLLVLVIASLLSVAFSAFQVSFDAHLWVLILMGIAISVSGYITFEMGLRFMAATEDRERATAEETRQREEEWLRRVGTPARLETITRITEIVFAMREGSDYTVMFYYGSEGGGESRRRTELQRQRLLETLGVLLERVKQGKIREYKRIICFDRDVLANDPELKSGVLRVGEGPGTIDRTTGDHCRLIMNSKACSLYVAPAVLHSSLAFLGVDQVVQYITVDEQGGGRMVNGGILFCDPPNGEIVEQFRRIERATERHMVAVNKIVFPEDVEPKAVAR